MLLVTKTITFPVGFTFYSPDPVVTAWRKEDSRLKKAGIVKKDRPAEPEKNPDYPSKLEIALTLLQPFKNHHPEIKINKEVKLEFKDTGRGSACVILDTETYITELCAWDNASCLDIHIIEIQSEESTYPHTGECESLAIFEENLKEYLK